MFGRQSPCWLQAWTGLDTCPALSALTRSHAQPSESSAAAPVTLHRVDVVLTQVGTSRHPLSSKLRSRPRAHGTGEKERSESRDSRHAPPPQEPPYLLTWTVKVTSVWEASGVHASSPPATVTFEGGAGGSLASAEAEQDRSERSGGHQH